MSVAATIVAVLAIAGVFVSWFAGAVFFLQAARTAPGPARMSDALVAVAAWPFLTGRLRDAGSAEQAARIKVNKALVALFVCVMVAVAAISLATNLSRLSR